MQFQDRWELRLVGTPMAQRGAQTVPLPFERLGQVVAYLALRRDWVPRSEITALLWPDLTAKLASANLRKALFRLRDSPWGPHLQADGLLLRVPTPTDVEAFAALARAGRGVDALALCDGSTLLAGFDDDANEGWTDWLRTQRERWRSSWRGVVLQRLAEPLPADEGSALAAALLAADPLDEAALQAQLKHLADAGQSGRARDAYRAFAARMQADLGLQPGCTTRALYERLQAASAVGVAAGVAPDGGDAGDDGYVGRAIEQRRIAELMQRADCRLLAIVGPGGIGKTRLARRALDEVAPLFADGAVFVALEDIDSSAGLLARLARAVGIERARPRAERDDIDGLIEHLRERRMLVVLDNFEHLAADAVPLLERLLAGVPGLKCIVTSRERLALGAQWALPLDGLPCPEPEDMDRLEAFDAARLFVAAARRADPRLDPWAERTAIVDICRQVDGLPLALELAAAWTRLLRCDQIAHELRQGTELLRAADPSFPPRQASVEAVFEQSWRLLGVRERDALARLSVFRGGFTVEAARAVADAPLPVLGALTDKSLLRKDGPRLALHPLLQQFAALKLGDGAAHTAARSAHAAHALQQFVGLQAQARAGEGAALREIDDEFENGRLAWQWLVAHGPASALAALARSLTDHADHRGRPQRVLALLRDAQAAPLVRADAVVRGRLLAFDAHLQYRLDRFADAQALAQQALALARGAGAARRDTRRIANLVLGSAALRLGQLSAARQHFRAVLELIEGTAAPHDRAAMVDHVALIEKRLDNLDAALQLALESLSLHRRLDDPAGLALCLNNLGSLHMARREPDAAAAPLAEALALCERGRLTSTLGLVLGNLCELSLALGDLDSAQRHGERALEIGIETGQRVLHGWMHADLATIAARRGDLDAARAALASAGEIALALDAPALKSVVVQALARLLHGGGAARAACRALESAIADPALSPVDRAALQRLHAECSEPGDASAASVGRTASAAGTASAADPARTTRTARTARNARDARDARNARDAAPLSAPLAIDVLLQRAVVEARSGHAALQAFLGA